MLNVRRPAMPRLLSAFFGVIAVILATGSAPVSAQTLVDSYTAEIAPQDRRNSRGDTLTDVAAILAQDRANFHRFGVRQPGDTSDTVFSDRSMRAAYSQLLSRGEITADALAAVTGAGTALVQVEMFRGASGDYLRVQLAQAAEATPPAAAGQLPTFGMAGTPAAGWSVRDDVSGMRGIAAVDPASGGLVSLECTRPGASAARFSGSGVLLPFEPGTLNLLVTVETFAGLAAGPAGQAYTVALGLDGNSLGSTSMATVGDGSVLGTIIPSNHPVFDQLRASETLTLEEASSGAEVAVPLEGLGAALDQLIPLCARPAEPAAAGGGVLAQQSGGGVTTPLVSAPTTAPAAASPAAAPAVPVGPALRGNEAVAQRMALWLLGQRPAFLTDTNNVRAVAQSKVPPGYPVYEAKRFNEAGYMQALGQAIAARAAQEAFPSTIEVDFQVRLQRRNENAPFRMRLQNSQTPTANAGLEGSIPEAIRTMRAILPNDVGDLFLREADPLLLPLPEALANLDPRSSQGEAELNAFQSDRLVLRSLISVGEPWILRPVGETRRTPRVVSVEAGMTVAQVTLIRQVRNQDGSFTDTALATWSRGAAPAATASAPPTFAVRYARGMEGDRVSVGAFNYREVIGLAPYIPATDLDLSTSRNSAALLVKAAALLSRSPETKLSDDALLELLFGVVDPVTRDRIVPPGFSRSARDSNLNEIGYAQALERAEPLVRSYVLENAPQFPLKVRMRALATIGEYDLPSQSFAWQLPVGAMDFIRDNQFRQSLTEAVEIVPDAIGLSPDQADTLIQYLEVDPIPSRMVPVILDYTITGADLRGASPLQITPGTIQGVPLTYQFENLRLVVDLQEQSELLNVAFPAPEVLSEEQTIPEAVYQTSANSLWATWAKVHNRPNDLMTYVVNRRDFRDATRNLSESQKAALATQEAQRIAGLARESFWLGLSLEHREYDPARGVLEMRISGGPTIPFGENNVGTTVVGAYFGRQIRDLQVPMSAEQYAQYQELVGTRRQTRALALATVAPDQDPGNYALAVSSPTEILIGSPTQMPVPEKVVLRLELEGDRTIETATAVTGDGTLTPPSVLTLNGEGLDLLTLAQQPGLYDAVALRRMFVERLGWERLAVQLGIEPDWGFFFSNPAEPLTPSTIEGLMPAFVQWTEARAAALPEQILVPYAISSRHPSAPCTIARRLPDGQLESRAFASVLGQAAPGYARPDRRQPAVDRITRPGPLDAIVVTGRASHPNTSCTYLPTSGRRSDLSPDNVGIDYGAAGYVDAVVVAEYPLAEQSDGQRITAVDYIVTPSDIQVLPVSPTANDQPGLRAVIAISGEVTALEALQADPRTQEVTRSGRIEAETWLSLLAKPDESDFDILGLKLGAPLAEVEGLALERIPGVVKHLSAPQAEPHVYGTGVGYAAPDRTEVLMTVIDDSKEDKPALALMSYRIFQPGTLTVDALKNSLIEKYGEPSYLEGEDVIYWGTPPREIDSYGACGGGRVFRGSTAPNMAPDLPDEEISRRRSEGNYVDPEWRYYGWPLSLSDSPQNYADPVRQFCGPTVLARVQADVYEQGTVALTIWMFDNAETERVEGEMGDAGTANIEL